MSLSVQLNEEFGFVSC